jgi:hypothetical protein
MEPVSFKKGYAQRNGPGGDCVPRPLVSELPAGSGLGARLAQPRFIREGPMSWSEALIWGTVIVAVVLALQLLF